MATGSRKEAGPPPSIRDTRHESPAGPPHRGAISALAALRRTQQKRPRPFHGAYKIWTRPGKSAPVRPENERKKAEPPRLSHPLNKKSRRPGQGRQEEAAAPLSVKAHMKYRPF